MADLQVMSAQQNHEEGFNGTLRFFITITTLRRNQEVKCKVVHFNLEQICCITFGRSFENESIVYTRIVRTWDEDENVDDVKDVNSDG